MRPAAGEIVEHHYTEHSRQILEIHPSPLLPADPPPPGAGRCP